MAGSLFCSSILCIPRKPTKDDFSPSGDPYSILESRSASSVTGAVYLVASPSRAHASCMADTVSEWTGHDLCFVHVCRLLLWIRLESGQRWRLIGSAREDSEPNFTRRVELLTSVIISLSGWGNLTAPLSRFESVVVDKERTIFASFLGLRLGKFLCISWRLWVFYGGRCCGSLPV